MTAVQLLIGLATLVANAFFVGAEFALISVRRSQIEPYAEQGDRRARSVLWGLQHVSVLMAAVVYFALSRLFVKPLTRLTSNMLHFAENPEDASRIMPATGRLDEIGVAERELASMQRQLSGLLAQKNRLAQLGLAVSKINHDLRNMLANAQLISDRLVDIPDPTVQRFVPKLIA